MRLFGVTWLDRVVRAAWGVRLFILLFSLPLFAPVNAIAQPVLDAEFADAVSTAEVPLTVELFDQSVADHTNILEWTWDSRDGSSSAQQDPNHTYYIAHTHPVLPGVFTSNGDVENVEDLIAVGANGEGDRMALVVTVLDKNSMEPITNAIVSLERSGVSASPVQSEDGVYTFSDIPRQDYQILVQAVGIGGFVIAETTDLINPGPFESLSVQLDLEREKLDCDRITAAGNIGYVSTEANGGSDTEGNGSMSRPWATIEFALSRLEACAAESSPITIRLSSGAFNEAVRLIPFVKLEGADATDNSQTVIAPTVEQVLVNVSDGSGSAVIANEGTGLSHLSIQLPASGGNGWRGLSISGVEMDVTNIDIDGANVQGSVGVLLSGMESSQSTISDSSIHNVEFGIRALETNATVRDTIFAAIEEDALFVQEPTTKQGPASTAVPDMGDVTLENQNEGGRNIFMGGDSIGGNFINNRNTQATVPAEANDFGTDDSFLISEKLSGNVDFQPRLFTGKVLLAMSLAISVQDAQTSTGISGATVTLTPDEGMPEEITAGAYLFQVLPFQQYVVDVSAPDYAPAQKTLDDPDFVPSLEFALQSTRQSTIEVAGALADNFTTADVDKNGTLSILEARTQVPEIAQAQFDELDSNRDGALTLAELEDFRSPTDRNGCDLGKAATGLSETFADLFILGVALLVLAGWRRMKPF